MRMLVEEEENPREPAVIPDWVPVRVIQLKTHSALVEWVVYREGGATDLRRAEVPREVMFDGVVERANLEAGIPFGLPWEQFLSVGVTPDTLGAEFRRLGLWTMDDLAQKPNKITEAVQRVIALSRGAVVLSAQRYLKNLEAKR